MANKTTAAPTAAEKAVMDAGMRFGMPGFKTECTKSEREHTPPALAEWLIELARRTRVPAAREAMTA